MKIIEVTDRTPDLIGQLLDVWEASVQATHLFLTDGEISRIKAYVPQALAGVAHLIAAENENDAPAAFMGIEDASLEMLFVSPEERGKGLGKALLRYGIERYGVERLAVNEQNPQATWVFRCTSGQTATNRAIRIRCCICVSGMTGTENKGTRLLLINYRSGRK